MTIDVIKPGEKVIRHVTADQIAKGVAFANLQAKSGFVRQETAYRALGAQTNLLTGHASENDMAVASQWAGNAEWNEQIQERLANTRRAILEKHGEDAVNSVESTINDLGQTLRTMLLRADPKDAQELLNDLRKLSNNLSGQETAQNGNPEKVKEAITAATEITSFE